MRNKGIFAKVGKINRTLRGAHALMPAEENDVRGIGLFIK